MRSLAVTALVVALSLSGCQEDATDPAEPATSATDGATTTETDGPYAAELTVVPGGDPAGPRRLTLENTGTKQDRYLVRVVPSTSGAVLPERVELRPGQTALVQLGQARSEEPVSVEAFSLGRSDVVASLELAAAE